MASTARGAHCAHTHAVRARFREIRPARSIAGPLYKVRSERSPDLNRYTEQSVFTTVLSGVRHGLVPCWCLSLFPLSRRSYQGEALQFIVTPQSPFPKKTSYSTIRA